MPAMKRSRERVRKIKHEKVKFGVFERTVKGESKPRSFKKYLTSQEKRVFRILKKGGLPLPRYRIIKDNLYIRAVEPITIHPGFDMVRPGLKPAERKAIAAQVADRLAVMHKMKVEHGDIRPDNVFRDPKTGQAFLLDFDVATLKKINWKLATRSSIIEAFEFDYQAFHGFLRELGVPNPKQYLFRLINQYPVSGLKKQVLNETISRRFRYNRP